VLELTERRSLAVNEAQRGLAVLEKIFFIGEQLLGELVSRPEAGEFNARCRWLTREHTLGDFFDADGRAELGHEDAGGEVFRQREQEKLGRVVDGEEVAAGLGMRDAEGPALIDLALE